MKTKEERNALKEKTETQSRNHHVLTEKELDQVTGGINSKSNHKGDVIVFKMDAPTAEEADVVELNTANLIFRGEVLVPADIDIPE